MDASGAACPQPGGEYCFYERHIGLRPIERHIGLRPIERHIGLRPIERHSDAASTGMEVVWLSDRPAGQELVRSVAGPPC